MELELAPVQQDDPSQCQATSGGRGDNTKGLSESNESAGLASLRYVIGPLNILRFSQIDLYH